MHKECENHTDSFCRKIIDRDDDCSGSVFLLMTTGESYSTLQGRIKDKTTVFVISCCVLYSRTFPKG